MLSQLISRPDRYSDSFIQKNTTKMEIFDNYFNFTKINLQQNDIGVHDDVRKN